MSIELTNEDIGDQQFVEGITYSQTNLPSGKHSQFAIENGPVEIVDLPSYIAW